MFDELLDYLELTFVMDKMLDNKFKQYQLIKTKTKLSIRSKFTSSSPISHEFIDFYLEKDDTITFKCKTYKVNYLYDFFEKYTKSKEFKKDYVKAKFKKTTGCGFTYIKLKI